MQIYVISVSSSVRYHISSTLTSAPKKKKQNETKKLVCFPYKCFILSAYTSINLLLLLSSCKCAMKKYANIYNANSVLDYTCASPLYGNFIHLHALNCEPCIYGLVSQWQKAKKKIELYEFRIK